VTFSKDSAGLGFGIWFTGRFEPQSCHTCRLALPPVGHSHNLCRARSRTTLPFRSGCEAALWDSLIGAIVAVMTWIGLSYLLGSYFRHFDNLDRTYGPLGAAIGLYVWFYLSCFAILVGGEINFLLLATCPTSPHRSSLALPRRSSFLKTRYAKRAAPSWIG